MRVWALGLVALALIWFAGLRPWAERLDALEPQVAAAEAEATVARAAARQIPALRNTLRQLDTGGWTMEAEEASGPDAIAELQSAAAAANLRILTLKPRTEPAAEAGAQSFELGVSGTFRAAADFLTTVAASPRVMTSTDLLIRAGSASDSHALNGLVTITAYERIDPDAPRPAAADVPSRDPFARPPLEVPVEPERIAAHSLASTPLAEVVVRGTVREGARALAILESTARRSFVVKPEDRLADARVLAVEARAVTFEQRGEQVRKSLEPARGARR